MRFLPSAIAALPPPITPRMPPRTLRITNALLPTKRTAPGTLYDLECRPDGSWSAVAAITGSALASPGAPFSSVTEMSEEGECTLLNVNGSLVLPGGLVHPHLHLDKCFLLDRCKLETGYVLLLEYIMHLTSVPSVHLRKLLAQRAKRAPPARLTPPSATLTSDASQEGWLYRG